MQGIVKKLGTICAFSLLTFMAAAQEQSATTPGSAGTITEITIADLTLKPLRLPSLAEVGGSVFMTPEFNPATVKLASGAVVKNVPVKFNIFSNALVVLRDGQELKLESFELVDYTVVLTTGDKHFIFSQGYPDIDNHSSTTVYQVLSKGPNVHLLKFFSQKVEDAPTLGDYSRRELVTTQQLYIYFPGGEIKKISTGKKAVSEALSPLSAKTDEILKAKSLNLKNESDLVVLVEELNKQ